VLGEALLFSPIHKRQRSGVVGGPAVTVRNLVALDQLERQAESLDVGLRGDLSKNGTCRGKRAQNTLAPCTDGAGRERYLAQEFRRDLSPILKHPRALVIGAPAVTVRNLVAPDELGWKPTGCDVGVGG
jgi:hypothetical protein